MRASELATEFPTVTLATPAVDAARQMAGNDLPGLIVLGQDESPFCVLPAAQVLRMAVPQYIQDDPALAGVIDEAAADTFIDNLGDHTVRELLPPPNSRELPTVTPDATLLEIAALMAQLRVPVVAVVDGNTMHGAITADALLDHVLGT